MKTCDTQHKEIQFESRECPLCELLADRSLEEMTNKENKEQSRQKAIVQASKRLRALRPKDRSEEIESILWDRLDELDPVFVRALDELGAELNRGE